jgi:hypothetical protein
VSPADVVKWGLFAAVLFLQAADGWTTFQVLRLGRGHEANPNVKALMDRFGVYWGLMAAKAWVTLLAVGLLVVYYYFNPWCALIGLASIVIAYVPVIINNYRVLYPKGRQ